MLVGLDIQGEPGINFHGYEVYIGVIGFIITTTAYVTTEKLTDDGKDIPLITNEEIERD